MEDVQYDYVVPKTPDKAVSAQVCVYRTSFVVLNVEENRKTSSGLQKERCDDSISH